MSDLRLPSGLFFLITGVILIILGVAVPSYKADLVDLNVNLYSGLSMAIFGGILLWLARRAA